jgi:tungstate transport system ATP-binding protein
MATAKEKSMMVPILQLKNIKYIVHEQTILNIPELSLNKGTIMGVMGPNGAGKSTLLKIMAMLEEPNEGQINYHGTTVSPRTFSLEQRRNFAIAMQQSLLLNTSVYQNVAIGLKLRNLPSKVIKERVDFWLEKFRIAHLAKKHAAYLSGGEAQRVNLARAMVLEPEVLFLDEPFSALDFPTKVKLLKDMKEIIQLTNTTTFFISHDMLETKYLTDTLLILQNGEVKQIGTTNEVIANPNEATAEFLNEWALPL